MAALLGSLGLFAAAWLLHLLWWRWNPPRRHLASLAALFAAVAAAALTAWALGLGPLRAAEWPAVLALYAGASACYLIVYTGIEQTSPTLVIVRELERARGAGCAEAELSSLITDDLFVRPRLDAMALDGIIADGPGGWTLTPRGVSAARGARLLSRVFGIGEGA